MATREFTIVENHSPRRTVEVLTDDATLARFAEEGYVHLPSVFDGKLGGLRAAVERVATEERANLGQAHGEGGFGGMFLRHLMDKDESCLALFRHPVLLPIARAMLGPMVRVLPLTARISVPGEPGQVTEWHIHQRLVPVPTPPFFSQPVVLDALIYLDDTDPETGPLQVVPGSHRWTDRALPTRMGDIEGAVTVMPKAGDVIFTHGNVWHRALPTTPLGRRRRLLILPYAPTWVELPTFGERPENGLLTRLKESADPETRELLGDSEGIY